MIKVTTSSTECAKMCGNFLAKLWKFLITPWRDRNNEELTLEELDKNRADIEESLKESLNYFSQLEYTDSNRVIAVFSVLKNKLMRPELYRTWLKGLYRVQLIELTETSDYFEWKFPLKLDKTVSSSKIKESVISTVVNQQEELESFL